MDGGDAPVTRTTCPYCGVGCGILIRQGPTGPEVRGDPDHPANFGRLCSKGAALGETLGLERRLLTPRVNGAEASWDAALSLVADRFRDTVRDHGPDSVAFYVSGQFLTEDYYVANKLMKGYIGSGNIDTNSRLCMASSVAGHRRAFGTDTVPGLYEDLELADLVVLTGSNLAWCHPVLYQRLAAAKTARPAMKVVVIDPRRTATCDLADLHLAISPGADAVLFNRLLAEIDTRGRTDRDWLHHVGGYGAALAAARATDPAATGLPPADLRAFFDLWTATEKVVTVYSQGINQSATGTDKVNAIINCHLATGRIGRPGMGPFSVTGQPNAMGGREVGGMANMLACHLELDNPSHRRAVQTFWASPVMADRPGFKAVDMFRAVGDGRIKAIWIMCTNPVASMPDADAVRAALAGCDFVVVSEMTAGTETAALADVLLPATGWGEKDGTVTNSERRISRQRRFLAAPGQARDDWRIIADVARRMGYQGFGWADAAEVFAEYAALSGVAGAVGSDFDISDHAGITSTEYEALSPFLWPANSRRRGGRFFGDGRFHSASGRAAMVAVTPAPPQPTSADHPFRLNTGRVRDHWHTMTRTGLSPRLSQHMGEPFVELHPDDARTMGLEPATLAKVTSPSGSAILRVLITDRVMRGQPFAPIHWTQATAPTGRIDALVAPVTDPVSGQPALKSSPVSITPFDAGWFAFAVTSARDRTPDCEYWARAATLGGDRFELAGRTVPADWQTTARAFLGVPDDAEAIAYDDSARGQYRGVFSRAGVVCAAIYVAREPVAVARGYVADQLGQPAAADLLAGRPGGDKPDPGATICACFGIGRNTITAAAEGGLTSVGAIGHALRAGTNCGSCRPEIAALIAACRPQLAVAAE